MDYSQEQKKILKCISELTNRNKQQPRAIYLHELISSLIPHEFVVCYDLNPSQNSIWLKSFNPKVEDEKFYDKNLGTVILTLFLLENLLKNNLILCYQNNEGTKTRGELYTNIEEYNRKEDVEKQSKHYKSPDFTRLLELFSNHKLLPNLSLIELTRKDFKTENEIANKNALRNSRIAIWIAVIALLLSTTAQTFSVFQSRKSLRLSHESINIDKQALEYSKLSATDSTLNTLHNTLEELPLKIESKNEAIIEELKTLNSVILKKQSIKTQDVNIISIDKELKKELINNNR